MRPTRVAATGWAVHSGERKRAILCRALQPAVTAVAFLTRVPWSARASDDPADIARSTPWFPLVGAAVGVWGALLFGLAWRAWSPSVAAVVATAGTVWLTGALHEDAVADAFDAFGGGWSREDVLRILKDSRVGSFGVVALALVLLAKIGALASLPPASAARTLIAAHALARWSSLPLLWRLDYISRGGSKSTGFARSVTARRLVAGTFAALAVLCVALGATPGRAALAGLVAVVVTLAGGRYFRRRLGGITGDCLGVTNQLVELAVYLVVAGRAGA